MDLTALRETSVVEEYGCDSSNNNNIDQVIASKSLSLSLQQQQQQQQQQWKPLLLDEELGQRPAHAFTFWEFRTLEVPGSICTVQEIGKYYRWKNFMSFIVLELALLIPFYIVVNLIFPQIQYSDFGQMLMPFIPFLLPVFFLGIITCLDRHYFYKHGIIDYCEHVKRRRSYLPPFIGGFIMLDMNLGYHHELRGDYTEAIACYSRFLNDDFPFLRNELGGICVYKSLGRTYYALGRYQAALDNYLKAVQLRRLKSNPTSTFKVATASSSSSSSSSSFSRPSQYQHDYHCLGQTYKAMKKFPEALESYQKAIEILQRHYSQTIDIAKSYMKIGVVYEEMKDIDNAIQSYHHALEIYVMNAGDKHPKSTVVAKLYDQLGDLYNQKIKGGDDQQQLDEEKMTSPSSSSSKDKDDSMMNEAIQYWDSAVLVYRRLGKTDHDTEIINIHSKISSYPPPVGVGVGVGRAM